MRVASKGSGGTFHIEVDGVKAAGPITIPNTGGCQIWTTLTISGVSLASGPHVLKIVMETDGASGSVGNFNWMQVR